ncbi:hypothetical protein D3C74_110260 [compost metagenome]
MRDMGNERKAPHRFWGRKLLLLLDRALVLVRYSWEMLILVTLSFTETSPLFIWPEAPVLMKTPDRLLPVSTVWKLHCRRPTSRYMPTAEATKEID